MLIVMQLLELCFKTSSWVLFELVRFIFGVLQQMVISFDSYGVMVLTTDVSILTKPKVHECIVQAHSRPRPMISLDVSSVHAASVLENRFQVWIVENEGNVTYPLNYFARDTILPSNYLAGDKFLIV